MYQLKGLKDVSSTQILGKGLNLKDIFKKDFISDLKKRLNNYDEIIASDVRLMLIPKGKETELKEDEKGVIIKLKHTDFLRIEQPSPEHYKDKVVVITSNRKGILDKVLK